MTNPKIAPRVDDDGVPWCDAECPQCRRTQRRLAYHATATTAHDCALWDFWMSPFDVCPVAVKRMAAENRALREWGGNVKAFILDGSPHYLSDAVLDTYPAATEEE